MIDFVVVFSIDKWSSDQSATRRAADQQKRGQSSTGNKWHAAGMSCQVPCNLGINCYKVFTSFKKEWNVYNPSVLFVATRLSPLGRSFQHDSGRNVGWVAPSPCSPETWFFLNTTPGKDHRTKLKLYMMKIVGLCTDPTPPPISDFSWKERRRRGLCTGYKIVK